MTWSCMSRAIRSRSPIRAMTARSRWARPASQGQPGLLGEAGDLGESLPRGRPGPGAWCEPEDEQPEIVRASRQRQDRDRGRGLRRGRGDLPRQTDDAGHLGADLVGTDRGVGAADLARTESEVVGRIATVSVHRQLLGRAQGDPDRAVEDGLGREAGRVDLPGHVDAPEHQPHAVLDLLEGGYGGIRRPADLTAARREQGQSASFVLPLEQEMGDVGDGVGPVLPPSARLEEPGVVDRDPGGGGQGDERRLVLGGEPWGASVSRPGRGCRRPRRGSGSGCRGRSASAGGWAGSRRSQGAS